MQIGTAVATGNPVQRDQLAFQHALMDAMPDPMFVRDLQGRLIMCNKSYEDALSTRFDRMQGRQLIEVDAMPRQTAELLHAEFMGHVRADGRVATRNYIGILSSVNCSATVARAIAMAS